MRLELTLLLVIFTGNHAFLMLAGVTWHAVAIRQSSGLFEVTANIHPGVQHANNVDGVFFLVERVEDDMLAGWKGAVARRDFGAVDAEQGILGQPFESGFDLAQVGVRLILAPLGCRVFPDAEQMRLGSRRDADISHSGAAWPRR